MLDARQIYGNAYLFLALHGLTPHPAFLWFTAGAERLRMLRQVERIYILKTWRRKCFPD